MRGKAQDAADNYVDSCVKYRRSVPSGCPFRYGDWRDAVRARWVLDRYAAVVVTVGPGARSLRVRTVEPGQVRFSAVSQTDGRPLAASYRFQVSGAVALDPDGTVFLRPD